MLNIGSKITELRKAKKWSQNDLAKAVDASRDIIGKYERGDNSPSIEMALKLANVFDVSVDYLLGEGQNATFDKQTLNLIQDIESLEPSVKERLLYLANAIIRDAKTQKAYS